MKTLTKMIIASALLTLAATAQSETVSGHFRSNGTYVAPYPRISILWREAILILSERILIMPPRWGWDVVFGLFYKHAAPTALPVRPKRELLHSLACRGGEGKKESGKWAWLNRVYFLRR